MTYIYICWWWCWSGGFRGNLFLHKASRFVFGFQRFTETSSKPLFGISSNIGWVWPWIAKNPAFSLQIRIVLKGSHHWKTGTGIALGVYRYTIYIYIYLYIETRERDPFSTGSWFVWFVHPLLTCWIKCWSDLDSCPPGHVRNHKESREELSLPWLIVIEYGI